MDGVIRLVALGADSFGAELGVRVWRLETPTLGLDAWNTPLGD